MVDSGRRFIRRGISITSGRRRLESLEVAIRDLTGTARNGVDASIAVAFEDVRRESSAAQEGLVASHFAESAARRSREAVMNTRIDRTAGDLEGLVMHAARFMSDFHAKM